MKPRKQKDQNPLVQVTILRERLKRSLTRERQKSKALNAMRAQLLIYAKDLNRSLDRKHHKNTDRRVSVSRDGATNQELTQVWAQLLVYAKDLKDVVSQERQKSKELQIAHEQMLQLVAALQKNGRQR